MIKKVGLAAALLVSSQVATAASIPNMGFESGLTGWLALPGSPGSSVSVLNTGATVNGVSVSANEGSKFAAISGSGALLQFANIVAGKTYGFAYRFMTRDSQPFDDAATLFKVNSVASLASVAQSGNTAGNSYDSGWKNFYFTSAVSAPQGTVMFNLFNAEDSLLNSHLLLDAAVPLPGAALLFGSALLGAGALRRKQKAAKTAELAAA